jgi:hypothetical protein
MRRALRIADEMIEVPPAEGRPPPDFWRGIADALRWTLGLKQSAPLSARFVAADPDSDDSPEIVAEIEYADACFHGGRRPVRKVSMSYTLGVQDGLMWAVSGQAFADVLHDQDLRAAYNIDPPD